MQPSRHFGIGSANDAAWSPDGSALVTAAPEGGVYVWDTASGNLIRALPGHRGFVYSVDWSPDGQWLVSGGEDGTARLWNAATGAFLSFVGDTRTTSVLKVRFSKDSAKMLVGDASGCCQVWNTASGDLITSIATQASRGVGSAGFSPDGSSLATSGWTDGKVRLWDAKTGQLLHELGQDAYVDYPYDPSFSDDGQRLLTFSHDAVYLWNASSGAKIKSFDVVTSLGLTSPSGYIEIEAAAFAPDQQSFLVQTLNFASYPAVTLHDLTTGQTLRTFFGHLDFVLRFKFQPAQNRMLTMSYDGTLRQWDFAAGQCLAVRELHDYEPLALSVSRDASRIMTAYSDGKIRVWDGQTGRQCCLVHAPPGPYVNFGYFYRATMDAAGKRVLTAAIDGHLRIWNAATGDQLSTFSLGNAHPLYSVGPLSLSADDSRLAVELQESWGSAPFNYHSETLVVFDTATGDVLNRFDTIGPTAFLSRDRVLVSDGSGFSILDLLTSSVLKHWAIWDIHSVSGSSYTRIDCTADGRQVISGCYGDASARIWDPDTAQPIRALPGHVSSYDVIGVSGVALSPNGRTAATTDDDYHLRVWDLRKNEPAQMIPDAG